MSPHLLARLYAQIKRVIDRPIALADRHGLVQEGYADFRRRKKFSLASPLNADRRSIPIEGEPNLQALPIFLEGKFYVLIITELLPEENQMVDIISSLAELIIQQFVAEFRPRPDAVDLLLTRMAYRPLTIDREELEYQMAALGYRLDVQRTALAVELSGFWDNYLQTAGQPLGEKDNLIIAKKNDLQKTISGFFTKNQDNIVGYIGQDVFLVLKDLQESDYERFCELIAKHFSSITAGLKNIHIKEVTLGIGLPALSVSGLLRSVQEALQVLRIGKKVVGADRAHRYQSLGILPLILSGATEQKQDYANRLFSALDDPELVETLEAFLLANLNLTQTADRLNVHRNTVIYRLNKIAEKIGKDPRDFPQAVELYLGILFKKFFI